MTRPVDQMGSKDINWIVLSQEESGLWKIVSQTPFDEVASETQDYVSFMESKPTMCIFVDDHYTEAESTEEEE